MVLGLTVIYLIYVVVGMYYAPTCEHTYNEYIVANIRLTSTQHNIT